MDIKWFGTASLEVFDGDSSILFDPFLRMNKKLTPRITPDDFASRDAIFVTHGHFDHIIHIPQIASENPDTKIYCTETPSNTLQKYGVPASQIEVIKPGDKIKIGDMEVTVYKGKHIRFDMKYVMSIVPLCAVMLPQAIRMGVWGKLYPNNDEIVCFKVEKDDKSVFIMGSYGTVDYEKYPENVSMFVLPYGGCTAVPKRSNAFVGELKPETVFISHHDKSFPPLTRRMNAEKLRDYIYSNHPGTNVIVPSEKDSYEI